MDRRHESLRVESLENRRPLAVNVAFGAEIGATSTPVVGLMNAETGAVIAKTLAFEASFRGGTRVCLGDVDGDKVPELIVGSGLGRVGEVRVFAQQVVGATTTLVELPAYRTYPFGRSYTGGVDVASGDVDGNGREDIVAAASRGRGTVNVFRSVAPAQPGGDPVPDTPWVTIQAFGPTFNGGASVAVGDLGTFVAGRLVNATATDGKVEIVVGSGAGMLPTVQVWDVSVAAAPRLADTVLPFSAALQGGVSVSTVRYDDNPIEDIVATAGRGGGGVTEIYNGQVSPASNPRLARFAAFAGTARPNAPTFVVGIDRNGDGRADGFIGGQGDAGGSFGIAFLGQTGARAASFNPLVGPLRVAAARTAYDFSTTAVGNVKYRDLAAGTGAAAATGQWVTLHYKLFSVDGTLLQDSRTFGKGDPFKFQLGGGGVIQGFNDGVLGMRPGGRRTLVLTAAQAYGTAPLVFEIEVLSISNSA